MNIREFKGFRFSGLEFSLITGLRYGHQNLTSSHRGLEINTLMEKIRFVMIN